MYFMAKVMDDERQREIEAQVRIRSVDRSQIRHRSLRHRLGQRLIQLGSMLAADGPLQLAARR
jgi:hypothetical protein